MRLQAPHGLCDRPDGRDSSSAIALAGLEHARAKGTKSGAAGAGARLPNLWMSVQEQQRRVPGPVTE